MSNFNPMYRPDRKRHNRFVYRHEKYAYLMLLPAFLLLTVFVIAPLVMAIVRSFQDYQTGGFVGWYNYEYVLGLKDLFGAGVVSDFLKSFGNVLVFTLIITAVMVVTTFLFALVLKNMNNSLGSVAKVVIYIPFFISGIIASIIFTMLTNYGGGLVNSILISLGKDTVALENEGILPYIAVIVPTIWIGFGYNTLVMYAGIINIPKEYYEAASIDGANGIQQMWHITLPNMKNYFVLIIINLVTANMQMMEIPYMMTGGGPLNATLTPVLYLFNSFRDPNRPQNVSIAGALIIMVFIAFVNVFVFKVVKSEKSQDS